MPKYRGSSPINYTLLNGDNKAGITTFLINEKVDVIIADLGISSYQLLHSSRGFSFDEESVLDMRIDKKQPLTAHRIVNNYNIEDLSDVIKNFGEEKNHFKIASAIVRHRSREEIKINCRIRDMDINFDGKIYLLCDNLDFIQISKSINDYK